VGLQQCEAPFRRRLKEVKDEAAESRLVGDVARRHEVCGAVERKLARQRKD
jgi:hypothetical protein